MSEIIRIAYVEDEPSIAELLCQGLSLFGIVVQPICISAEDFIHNFASDRLTDIDMFVFDIRLPKMTGIELAKEIRHRGETRPLLLVSAWPSPDKMDLESINAYFLPKPFNFGDIVSTIQNAVAVPAM